MRSSCSDLPVDGDQVQPAVEQLVGDELVMALAQRLVP